MEDSDGLAHARKTRIMNVAEIADVMKSNPDPGTEMTLCTDLEPIIETIRRDRRDNPDQEAPFNLWMTNGTDEIVDIITWNNVTEFPPCPCCGKPMTVETYYSGICVSCGNVEVGEPCKNKETCSLPEEACDLVHENGGINIMAEYVAFEIFKILQWYGICIVQKCYETVIIRSLYMLEKWAILGATIEAMKKKREDGQGWLYIIYDVKRKDEIIDKLTDKDEFEPVPFT